MKIFCQAEINTIIKEGGEKIQLTTQTQYIPETNINLFCMFR